ncbi:MAG: hypothetical protein ACFFA6_01490 [Promethearchaeota archaeon]
MISDINEETKKEIIRLISIPGIDIEDIMKRVNLDYETVMKVLSDEYLKCNLDYGRRLCCRF